MNSPSKKIVGTWQSEEGYTMVFQSNGQFSLAGLLGTYTIEDDMLTLCPILSSPIIYRFELYSNKLIIYDDKGDSEEMQRVKHP